MYGCYQTTLEKFGLIAIRAWKDLAQFPALTALPNGDVPIAMKEQMEFSDVVYDQFCWETDYVPVACDMFAAVQSNNV